MRSGSSRSRCSGSRWCSRACCAATCCRSPTTLLPSARGIRDRGRCASQSCRAPAAAGAHRLRALVNDLDAHLRAGRRARARRRRAFAIGHSRSSSRRPCSQAIESGGVLIAEAGTGTGKDLRLPRARAPRRRTRDHLHRDRDAAGPALPSRPAARARGASARRVDVALLKGRANYVCLHHLEAAAAQGTFGGARGRRAPPQDPPLRARHHDGRPAANARTSRRPPRAWAQATSTRENCLGSACAPLPGLLRDEGAQARCRRRRDRREPPPFLCRRGAARRGRGRTCFRPANTVDLRRGAPPARPRAPLLRPDGLDYAGARARARRAARAGAAREGRHRDRGGRHGRGEGGARRAAIAWAGDGAHRACRSFASGARFDASLDALAGRWPTSAEAARTQESARRRSRNCRLRCDALAALIGEWRDADAAPEGGCVRRGNARPTVVALGRGLRAVGGPLRHAARRGPDLPRAGGRGRSAPGSSPPPRFRVNGDFSHYQSETGLAEATTQTWASPFDFATQALLYVPEGCPIRTARATSSASSTPRGPSCARAAAMRSCSSPACAPWTAGTTVCGASSPGKGSIGRCCCRARGRRTRSSSASGVRRNAILVGSQSFWEGVDVKGEQLSVVVIDRLPVQSARRSGARRVHRAHQSRRRQRLHGLPAAARGDRPRSRVRDG